jgi:hypothetical protein
MNPCIYLSGSVWNCRDKARFEIAFKWGGFVNVIGDTRTKSICILRRKFMPP